MFNFRAFVVALCFSSFVICALFAEPKRTPKQEAQDKCDLDFANCNQNIDEHGYTGALRRMMEKDCADLYDACYKKIGLKAPPRAKLPPRGGPTAQPLASPSASPNKLQPQGTLTRVSPTPTPNNREKKKKH